MDRRIIIFFAAIAGVAMIVTLMMRLERVLQEAPPPTPVVEVAQVQPTAVKTETPVTLPTRVPTETPVPAEVTVVVTATPTETPLPKPTEQPTEVPTLTPTLQPTIEPVDDGRVDTEDEATERLVAANVATNADEIICGLVPDFSAVGIDEQLAFKCFPIPGTGFSNPVGDESVDHAVVLEADGQIVLILQAPPTTSIGSSNSPADTTYTQPDDPEPVVNDPPDPAIDEPPSNEGSGGCESCQAPSTEVSVPDEPDEPMPTAIF